jgi:hypothetical protein
MYILFLGGMGGSNNVKGEREEKKSFAYTNTLMALQKCRKTVRFLSRFLFIPKKSS